MSNSTLCVIVALEGFFHVANIYNCATFTDRTIKVFINVIISTCVCYSIYFVFHLRPCLKYLNSCDFQSQSYNQILVDILCNNQGSSRILRILFDNLIPKWTHGDKHIEIQTKWSPVQTSISNTFLYMWIVVFWFRCHWNLFQWIK